LQASLPASVESYQYVSSGGVRRRRPQLGPVGPRSRPRYAALRSQAQTCFPAAVSKCHSPAASSCAWSGRTASA